MRKERIFFVINEACEALSLSNRPRQALNLTLNVLSKSLGVDAGWVLLTGTGNREEVLAVSRGLTAAQARELQAPGLRRVLEDRLGTGDLVVVPDLVRDGHLGVPLFVKAGFGSMVVVPLVTGRSRGTLGAMWRATKGFDTDYGYLLMVVGSLVCSTLERAALYERLLGGAELEPDIKYDIEEFEKLVALAEQYSRATRLAISEAVVRAKGTESAAPRPLEVGAGVPPGEPGKPGNGDGAPMLAGEPAPAPGAEAASPEPGPFERHEQRMRAFVRLHARIYGVFR